tara:strand:+ start:854 stop:2722 length:1869 start_codon:yes stop_codon:yes gene_type:complete
MSDEDIDRKIAVIFATDVVGYSKHMEVNESETVKNLRSCEKLLTELFEKHNGRLFNSGGDSFLAEFPSAVSAVECAVEFQNIVKERNSSDATTVKLQFRIGINSGDVIKEKDNLLGDGVNIAARLEALAQPGGIALSKVVYDYVKGKTEYEFNDLGIQKVKENAFHVFDILLDPSHRRSLASKSRPNLPLLVAIVIAAFVAIIAALYLNPLKDKSAKTLVLETSSKPRILVMPIKTSGLAEDQMGFGNGITESMIATLSGYKAITVLSSSTSFHAEKISMIDESIRDEFGVDYLIRGSMQVMGKNARLNLEITDLDASKVTVSKKRDFELDDIFGVQDELSDEILTELQISLGVGSGQGSNWADDYNSMEDFNLFLNWREEWRKFTKGGYINSNRMFNELKSSYPNEARPLLVVEAWQLQQKLVLGLSKRKEKDLDRLSYILNRAIELDPNSPDAFAARSAIGLMLLNRNCVQSLDDIEKAEELGSTVDTLTIAGNVYERCGDTKRGIEAKRHALLLVPNDTGWFITSGLTMSLYRDNQIEEIYELIGEDISAEDMSPMVLAVYAFLEQQEGNIEKAKMYLERAKKNNFDRQRFERDLSRNSSQPDLLEKTIGGLLEIGKLE